MKELILSAYTISSAAGYGNNENLSSIKNNRTGLIKNNFLDAYLDTWIGRVCNIEKHNIPSHLKDYSCRNNQLAYLALQQDYFEKAILNAKKKIW